MAAKNLADQTLASVTLDSIAHTSTGDDPKHRQQCAARAPKLTLNNKRPAVDTMLRSADLLEIALFAQTL